MVSMMTGVSSLPRRRMVASLPAWFALAMAAQAQPTQTDVPPARVTSDSPEFCAQLAEQVYQEAHVHRVGPVPEEVHTLEEEGLKMCSEGRLRPGILRLRRALQILRGEGSGTPLIVPAEP
jgi:hypothetical protein